MLQNTGISIRYANSLLTAFAQMEIEPPPDLVLLDLTLPPDGPEQTLGAVEAFRRFNPELKVVVVTGMAFENIRAIVEKAKVQAVLHKDASFSQRVLLEAVQKQLATAKNTKEVTAIAQRLSELLARPPAVC